MNLFKNYGVLAQSLQKEKPVILGVLGEPSQYGTLTRYEGQHSYPISLTEEIDGDFVYHKWDTTKFPFNAIEEVIDDNGNVKLNIPKTYLKLVYDEGVLSERYISNKKFDDFFLPSCFIDPITKKELPYYSFAKYLGSEEAGVLVSKSGKDVKNNITPDDARTLVAENGSNFHLVDFFSKLLMETIYLIVFANTIPNDYFPQGTNGSPQKTGGLDAMTYHTGYSKEEDNYRMKFLGIEDYFSNYHLSVDGIKFVDREAFVCDDYTKFNSLENTDDYTSIGTLPEGNKYIDSLGIFGLPKTGTNVQNQYYENTYWSAEGYKGLYIGRMHMVSGSTGLFLWRADISLTNKSVAVAYRLVSKPI